MTTYPSESEDLSPLAVAVITLMDGIDRAGGWSVFDPSIQERIERAINLVKCELMLEIEKAHR